MDKKNKPKIIASRSLIAVLCICFGILVSAQLRSLPERVSNPIAPYMSLKETKAELFTEQDQLKNEVKKLQETIRQTQKENEDIVLTKEEIKSLNTQKNLAGLTKLNGPGIIIKIDDSKTVSPNEESIVHAADLRDIINLLWGSGAEGIAINSQRIVLSSAIDCIVNTILINNVRITTPFQVEAVGNQELMSTNLKDKARLANLYSRVSSQNIIFDLQENNDITVPAFDGSFSINSGAN
jgi:uncharacterized protein YlxW (UPF0749 family)